MNVLDLFSGIGGFSLGLERAGMRTVAFCECDPYCQRVLRRHWPDVPIFGDVRELTAVSLGAHSAMRQQPKERKSDEAARIGRPIERAGVGGLGIDVICGGFPCQDISTAGKGAGITGERSGLWSEYARIIGEVRPRYVIVENVAALLGRGIERVLGDLAALGYDAEWHCIPASAVGAPHRRDRVWIVAYANDRRELQPQGRECDQRRWSGNGREEVVADANVPRLEAWGISAKPDLAEQIARELAAGCNPKQWDEQHWFAQSGMGRVATGIPNRVDRLRALGNAVVPQIPEIIGRAIMSSEPP